jgi:hypothetical protein
MHEPQSDYRPKFLTEFEAMGSGWLPAYVNVQTCRHFGVYIEPQYEALLMAVFRALKPRYRWEVMYTGKPGEWKNGQANL